jgi:RNA polymerase sigma-70 factor (ECF subfamily)
LDSSPRDDEAARDTALVRAMAAGSTDALSDLYDRHAGVVFGLARRIVSRPEDAEEVVQDVFAQIWRQAARYDEGRATVAGWLVMLTRARAIDRLRARQARPDEDRGQSSASSNLTLAAPEPTPETATLTREQSIQIADALGALPDAQRTLLDLAYFEGLSHSQISARTGVPLGTVKTRIRSAMDTLRQKLAGTA